MPFMFVPYYAYIIINVKTTTPTSSSSLPSEQSLSASPPSSPSAAGATTAGAGGRGPGLQMLGISLSHMTWGKLPNSPEPVCSPEGTGYKQPTQLLHWRSSSGGHAWKALTPPASLSSDSSSGMNMTGWKTARRRHPSCFCETGLAI